MNNEIKAEVESSYYLVDEVMLLYLRIFYSRGTWVAQSIEHPTSAQVMISWSVGSSPASGSALTAQSLEPASDSMSPSLSAPPPLVLCLCLKNQH